MLAVWHRAGEKDVQRAIDYALAAHPEWSRLPREQRAAVFLKAADLFVGPWRVLEAAGLPPGVINMVPGAGAEVGEAALAPPTWAGIHFTGSTATFRAM